MEGKSEETPIVKLSPFKFTDWLKAPITAANNTDAKYGEPKPSNIPSQSYWGPQPPPDYRRPEAYERMAGDKPGEELAHDATIWKLYLEEAEEHDQELVKSRHGSLDMLLLFAALFSAILTAFLIESKDLLQQDPADASAALLLMVVQSQQRIELGLPSPVVTPLKDLPTFVPLASARWINGIWFTSLALSLSAALIAMLGKEWLTAYLASRPRPPHSHALLRQARLEGLVGWWALHIIALLPSLLHASLFLFVVGLVIYLWTLDAVVAGVMAGIIGITTLFYVVTAVLGAIYEHCPFVTQVSSYIKRAVSQYLRHQSQNEDHTGVTSVKDIQALLWLANKARDPAVVDCSFQALAGLRLPPEQANSTSDEASPDSPSQTPPSLPMQINAETTSLLLFCTVADRFERAMANPLLSSVADGLNLARYAAATVRLFKSLPPLQEDVLDNELDGHGLSVTGRIESSDRPRDATVKPMWPPSSVDVLGLLEKLWSDTSPYLSANAYAGILGAQLEVLTFAASFHAPGGEALSRAPMERPFSLTHGLSNITRAAHAIDMSASNSALPRLQQLAYLRAYYSRTLCQVVYLLDVYCKQKIKIEASSLVRLLDAVRVAAGCEILNPRDSISTHHAQRSINVSLSFRVHISAANEIGWIFQANDLSSGPLGQLIGTLRMKPDIAEEPLLRIRTAAVEAFSAFTPVLLTQVLQIDQAGLHEEFNFRTWSDLPTLDMKGVSYVVARQTLLALRYVGPWLGTAGVSSFCELATELIFGYIIDNGTAEGGVRLALKCHSKNLVPLLECIEMSRSHFEALAQPAKFQLLSFAQLASVTGITPCQTSLSPTCFPVLIRMIGDARMAAGSVQRLLESMVSRLRNGPTGSGPNVAPLNNIPSIEYLNCFTHTSGGFSAFSHAATYDECHEVVASAIAEFVHLAANPHKVLAGAPLKLQVPAVPGFLDVVSVVVKYCSGNSERQQILLDFSRDVVTLLDVAVEVSESRDRILWHAAPNDLCSALEKIDENDTSFERLDQLKRLMAKLRIRRAGQEDVTIEPSTEHADVNTPTDTTTSNDEDAGLPVDDGVVPSGNEEENTVQ